MKRLGILRPYEWSHRLNRKHIERLKMFRIPGLGITTVFARMGAVLNRQMSSKVTRRLLTPAMAASQKTPSIVPIFEKAELFSPTPSVFMAKKSPAFNRFRLMTWGQSLKASAEKGGLRLINEQDRIMAAATQIANKTNPTDELRMLFAEICIELANLRGYVPAEWLTGTEEEAYEAALSLQPDNEEAQEELSILRGMRGEKGKGAAKIFRMPDVYEQASSKSQEDSKGEEISSEKQNHNSLR